ncbi:MAG: hypothetical protein ACFFCW_32890 [Candidatus Hodarchaeota archaeon]
MNPQLVAAIASAVSSVILLISVIILVLQAREVRRATYGQSFKTVYEILQADDVREARGIVLRNLEGKQINTWSEDEKKAAEKVCHTYDSVGIMIRSGMIPVQVVADSWGDSLRRSWRILAPLVASYRTQRNSAEFWDDYEWLAREADRYRRTIHSP